MLIGLAPAWMLVKVGLVLMGLLGALALVNRRVRPDRTRGSGTSVRLTPQHSVHVVDIEGRRLLVGVGPSGSPRLLCVLGGGPGEEHAEAVPTRPRGGWDGY